MKLTKEEKNELLECMDEWQKERQKEKHKEIRKFLKEEFKKAKSFKVLEEADILYAGWECDPTLWLCQVDKKKILVTTNHGYLEVTGKGLLEHKREEYNKLATIYLNWLDQF